MIHKWTGIEIVMLFMQNWKELEHSADISTNIDVETPIYLFIKKYLLSL